MKTIEEHKEGFGREGLSYAARSWQDAKEYLELTEEIRNARIPMLELPERWHESYERLVEKPFTAEDAMRSVAGGYRSAKLLGDDISAGEACANGLLGGYTGLGIGMTDWVDFLSEDRKPLEHVMDVLAPLLDDTRIRTGITEGSFQGAEAYLARIKTLASTDEYIRVGDEMVIDRAENAFRFGEQSLDSKHPSYRAAGLIELSNPKDTPHVHARLYGGDLRSRGKLVSELADVLEARPELYARSSDFQARTPDADHGYLSTD